MPTCLICRQPPNKRDGYDRRGRQRYTCRPCSRDFTQLSGSAFSGYRWPAEVILAGMRWYLRYPLSARQVAELLAERGVDVSARTVLTWVQTFGPLLAKESHSYRRRLGRRWYVDELFLCRGGKKHYLYRAVDQRGQVVDVLLRERRDLASAESLLSSSGQEVGAGAGSGGQRSSPALREGSKGSVARRHPHPDWSASASGRDHQEHRT